MKELLKQIYLMIIELREISEANNELLGFLCMKIAPTKQKQIEIDKKDIAHISLEMSKIFEEYDIMPEDYGVS